MDRDGGGTQRPAAVTDAPSPSLSPPPIDEETLWQMNLRAGEFMEPGPFPERPGEPVCAYYTRTGFCRFGMACRFNHPPDGNLAVGAARTKGGYPERVGQPECQYYLKTGTCKFGATCKFHHPRDMAGVPGRATLNILGYPLRPNEMECAYYLRTGHCKFGNTCKFHHPQPSNSMVTVHGSSVYSPIHSSTPGQQSYLGGPSNWPLSRASLISSPRWQGSSYPQLMPSQGLVQVPSWNSYPRENVFPERPDQPECQFYMKTGDCKFGALCRFHHPKEWLIPAPNCALSPLRLPLRPGEPLCIFYSRYGICKFGPNCKFDHPMAMPMGFFAYNLSSSSAHAPVIQGLSGSTLPPLGSTEPGLASPRQSSHPESRQMNYGDGNIEVEDSHATASTGQGSSPT